MFKLWVFKGPEWVSQVALVVKNPPVNAGDGGSSPGWGRSLEDGKATHSSILAWRTPWTEEPGGLQSIGKQSQTQLKQLSTHNNVYLPPSRVCKSSQFSTPSTTLISLSFLHL